MWVDAIALLMYVGAKCYIAVYLDNGIVLLVVLLCMAIVAVIQ